MLKHIIFIEISHSFNRYDIIRRIIRISGFCKVINTIYLFILHGNPNLYIINREKYLKKQVKEPINILLEIISKCKNPVILDEKGKEDISLINESDCLISGLHSDPLLEIEPLMRIERVRLSNISYLASMLLPIIDFINSIEHNILLNSNVVN